MSSQKRPQGNIRLVLAPIPFVNTSATKQLLTRAVTFLKEDNLQGYFQAVSDAVAVNTGIDEDESPEEFQTEFEKLDMKLRNQ